MKIFKKLIGWFLIIAYCSCNIFCSPQQFLILPGICTGMFSNFNAVLAVLEYYERGQCTGMKVDFVPKHSIYHDSNYGDYWWTYYFEPLEVGDSSCENRIIDPSCQVGKFATLGRWAIPIVRANYLIKKYIKVKPHITNIVNDFSEKFLKNKYVIGIHYRGTDHYMEVKLATIEAVLRKLDDMVAELNEADRKNIVIFVATDTQQFLDAINSSKFKEYVVYKEQIRSSGDVGVHNLPEKLGNNYLKGEEALVDCLLLSRSNLLVRTSSLLSAAAVQFNPAMIVVNLNGPEKIFWDINSCPSPSDWNSDPMNWSQKGDVTTFLPKEYEK